MIAIQLIHYISLAACTAITSLGVAIGQGIASRASFVALNIQPAAKNDISPIVYLYLP